MKLMRVKYSREFPSWRDLCVGCYTTSLSLWLSEQARNPKESNLGCFQETVGREEQYSLGVCPLSTVIQVLSYFLYYL